MTPQKQPAVLNGSLPQTSSQPGFVKGLGLVSATTLVMGSMIGSGIFIVSADVARQVKSPGLLILCWLIGAALTIIAALSYGELAAAMPHAGGQYVYLREAFGRLWGFLYGWTLFVVIQTGTIAAVAVAFAKYTGVFLPSISAGNYLLGSGKIGLTTQQLLAIAVVVLLTFVNTRGIRTGAMVQNVFTFAKVASLLGLVGLGFLLGRNPQAIAANFHDFWRGRELELGHRRARRLGHGRPALLVRRVEQRHLHGGRSAQSETQSAALARLRRGRGLDPLYRLQFRLSFGAHAAADSDRAGRSRRHRRGLRHVRPGGHEADGHRDHDLDFRLLQRHDHVRRARLFHHGARQPVFPPRGHARSRSTTRPFSRS